MAKLIKNRDIVANDWTILVLEAGEAPKDAKLPYGNVLVPLSVWQERKWDLVQRELNGAGHQLGVWLGPKDDPAAIAGDLADLSVIGVYFPVAGDGRGYSIAALLRSRYGYRGELHALGAIERDYLHFLKRVGFDVFNVQNPESAIVSLDDFSEAYQPAYDQPLPLFRREPAALAA